MCDTAQRYLYQGRRRSDSLTLTIFQWSFGNRSPNGGSIQSIASNSELSPLKIESPPPSPMNIESPPSSDYERPNRRTLHALENSNTYMSRRELFRVRSISGSSLDSVSRTIATQTPTEDVHFIFPDPTVSQMDDNEEFKTSEDESSLCDEPDIIRSRVAPDLRRRHSLIEHNSMSSLHVARTPAMEIPGAGRRPLSHSSSYSYGVGVVQMSSVGQELRSIADAFDQFRVRASR